MSDEKRELTSNLNEDPDSNDSCFDVTSVNFDPVKAIYSSKMKIPVENAPLYDNVAMFSSKIIAGTSAMTAVGKTVRDKESEEKTRQEELMNKNARRFQPHQMPVTVKREFVTRNLMTEMAEYEGPLARLKNCMDSRIRVKVITRNHIGIRGYCIGYLEAFDKLWNLALKDVTEIWTRKVKKKVPAAIDANILTEELRRKLDLNRTAPPRILVKPAEKKGYEICERYVPQLMMRGEHVVLVSIFECLESARPSTSKVQESLKSLDTRIEESGSSKSQESERHLGSESHERGRQLGSESLESGRHLGSGSQESERHLVSGSQESGRSLGSGSQESGRHVGSGRQGFRIPLISRSQESDRHSSHSSQESRRDLNTRSQESGRGSSYRSQETERSLSSSSQESGRASSTRRQESSRPSRPKNREDPRQN